MTVRVYVGLTAAELERMAEAGSIGTDGVRARAVTAAVRDAFPDDDEESLEYCALWVAAENLARSHDGGSVVVAAADVPDGWVVPAAIDVAHDAYEVLIERSVPRSRVVALHVQEDEAGPDDELSWYDVSELDVVRHLLDRPRRGR